MKSTEPINGSPPKVRSKLGPMPTWIIEASSYVIKTFTDVHLYKMKVIDR